ncbi:MAG: radical SAM protein [Bdellovibrionaceae bacterium]|nr:radical SAM protein [Pseudobdellovibrionaceae bacterium]
MGKPFGKINIEISNICNLQCSFCPEVIRSKKLMDIDLFESIIRQVAPLTELVCFHLMGDPLVHPRLADLIRICEDHAVKIFFVTNGVLLREKQAALLESSAFQQINFSLHSFHDNYGDKDPTDYLERIFSFTEKALAERPELYLNYRLWNLQETRGTGPHNRSMLRRIEERFQVSVSDTLDIRKQKSRRLKGRLYLHFDTEFTWPSLDLPVLGTNGRCHGLSSHFGILVDGTVVPCCLDKEAAIPLGKVQEQPITEILAGARAKKILKGFRENRLEEELCQKCQYIERFRPVEPASATSLSV